MLAAIFLYIAIKTSLTYFQETNQKLNAQIAQHIVEDTEPFINGNINKSALERIFHNVMVLQPSVEVYLLDSTGNILSFSAQDSLIKTRKVNPEPLEKFIALPGEIFVKGDDPRHPGETKVFSAAPVLLKGRLVGYVYVVLHSDKFNTVASAIRNSYIFKIALQSFAITLIAALIFGLVAFRFITRNLNKIIVQIKEFQQGNWEARIRFNKEGGELKQL